MKPSLRLVEADNDCPICLLPRDLCECEDPRTRAIVRAHEDMRLRKAADLAIKRGYAQLSKRRSLWQRLRDAVYAFRYGLQ